MFRLVHMKVNCVDAHPFSPNLLIRDKNKASLFVLYCSWYCTVQFSLASRVSHRIVNCTRPVLSIYLLRALYGHIVRHAPEISIERRAIGWTCAYNGCPLRARRSPASHETLHVPWYGAVPEKARLVAPPYQDVKHEYDIMLHSMRDEERESCRLDEWNGHLRVPGNRMTGKSPRQDDL